MQLCEHSSRAMTESAGKPPYGSRPRRKPASPQQSSAGRAQAVLTLRLSSLSGCRAAGQVPTAAGGQPPLHTQSMYSKPFSVPSAMASHGAKPAWSSTSSTSSSKLLPMQTMQSLSHGTAPQLRGGVPTSQRPFSVSSKQ